MSREFLEAQTGYGFQRKIYYRDTVNSTNTWAAEQARHGAEEGTVYIADSQTSGRGRAEATWESPQGVNLYFSLILRPKNQTPETFSPFPLVVAKSLHEAVAGYIPGTLRKNLKVKWPNDLGFVSGDGFYRKIAGVLIEPTLEAGRFKWVVCGIGVDVNWMEIPDPLSGIVSSLALILGHPVDRVQLLADILLVLEREYRKFSVEGPREAIAYCNQHHLLTGQTVVVAAKSTSDETPRVGKALKILPDGKLEVSFEGKGIQPVYFGDVSIKPR